MASNAAMSGKRAKLTVEAAGEITLQNQLNSPLLRLPPELRNRIYELASRSTTVHSYHDTIIVDGKKKTVTFWNSKDTSLLAISQQIRHEASPIFYRLATFCTGFVRSPRPRPIKKLTTVQIDDFGIMYIVSIFDSTKGGRGKPQSFGMRLPVLECVKVGIFPFLNRDEAADTVRMWFGRKDLEVIFLAEEERRKGRNRGRERKK